ncbi:aromatic acid exporter family protein [Bacillaceae bacterium IKA-2]|nr:aromatic acid exporter family protein [Bacillaceae bacterium IKA-2]
MKLGARIFKTGLSITLSLYVAMFFNLEPPMYAAIAATFAIQPSIQKSFQTILEQIQANIISAILAITFVLTFGHHPVVVGVVVIIVIAINLKLKMESIIPLAVVTVIIIMESPTGDFISFAASRFSLILIGVLSAFIINLFFIPPKHETQLYHKIHDSTEIIIEWINLLTRHDAKQKVLKKDLAMLKDSTVKIYNLFLLYKEERNFLKKSKYSKARKVVLFRQMLATLNKALTILKALNRRENELHHLPEQLQTAIRTRLDCLTNYHERILLKYAGKVKTDTSDDLEEACIGKQELTELFMAFYKKKDIDSEEWLHLFPIVAHIVEYGDQLEYLDKLLNIFFTYHINENEVDIKERDD